MNNTNNALETLVQRDKQIKKANDKLKTSINELEAELSTHASNTDIHTSKEELIQLIVDHLESFDLGITKEVVSVLPTENISDNTLYFVPNEKGFHNEYLYINDKWELVGSTETNFTDYYTKLETNTLLEGKANSVHSHVVSDITDFPTIPTKLSQLENDMGFGSGSGGVITSISWTNITDKPNFSTVATSGSYNDLSDKPTIPKVYNKTLTIQKNGTNVATFTSNSNTDVTADITVPTKVSELSNDSGFITGISWDKVTNKPTLATVATSGSYTDLSNTPTIPTKVSQLENDTGFINALTDVVDTKSNQTINGTKTFNNNVTVCGDVYDKNVQADLTQIPTSNNYTQYRFVDKNNKTMGYVQHVQRTNGINQLTFIVRDSNNVDHGFWITTDKALVPAGNNTYSLGSSTNKWAKVYSDDVVHTSGNETIAGTKIFSNTTISNKDLHYKDTLYDWTDTSINTWCDAGHVAWFDKTGTRRMHELVGANGGVWRKACYINENKYFSVDSNRNISYEGISFKFNGKNIALDENLVHTNGDEVISGVKKFTNTIFRKNTAADLTSPSSSAVYTHYMFVDKNDKVLGFVEHAQRNATLNDIGLWVKDKDSNTHGVRITSNKEFLPSVNNTYSLGSASHKWANVYATTFNGNLKGTVDSSTTATTQATSDNSTRIATTAWVRTYVDSVAGSNTVGSSVSAYWSNSSNVTATGQASGGGYYPECYSEYITKTPTVGTIYSGAQLYTVLNTYASATASMSNSIYVTNNKAQATFSNPINASGKYLCTTANTVKFRAYTAKGSTSAVGASSVVDYTITKSIFIRVE